MESIESQDDLLFLMPKIELHAHLNGSISEEILAAIAEEFNQKEKLISLSLNPNNPNLADCFNTFAKIHEIVTTEEILRSATLKVLNDFSKDNVIHLELRTTPKAIHEIPDKDSYLKTVISAIRESLNENLLQSIKLLISIDRKRGEEDSTENLELAMKWAKLEPSIVVGLDLSGDPNEGSLDWILPLLEKGRQAGLRITLHAPEINNPTEAENLLLFQPDRLGHGVFLHPSAGGSIHLWNLLAESDIPTEICISSNLISGCVPSLQDHHVKYFKANKMPFVISTDDSGVFRTTLTKEFVKLLQVVPCSGIEIRDLCLNACEFSFTSEEEKNILKKRIKEFWNQYSLKKDI